MSEIVSIIAGNLVVAFLLALIALWIGRCRHRAALAHLIWFLVFVKLLTPPMITLSVTWLPAQEEHLAAIAYISNQSSQMLFAVWAVVFIGLTVRGLSHWIRFHRMVVREGKIEVDASEFIRELLGAERRHRSPPVVLLPIRVSPMLFGVGRWSIIVCPSALWETLDKDQRATFLAHEAGHYARCDHWVRLIEWLVSTVYWWLPVIYFANKQLHRHEEACCDAWAIARLKCSPRQYAETLLHVVDFISETHTRLPRMASGMMPTDSLEERLRSLMRGASRPSSFPITSYAYLVLCLSLWVVHPELAPSHRIVDVRVSENEGLSAIEVDQRVPAVSENAEVMLASRVELPNTPLGYWNREAPPIWADVALLLPGARLTADANSGISIERANDVSIPFSPDELTAIVELPQTKRVVIGDDEGGLRLWDLPAASAVSLIGRHVSRVTSLTYHDSIGLVSADDSGSVMRWNIQSGQVLATWSDSSRPIQSVRSSLDGRVIAVLVGHWKQNSDLHELIFLDSQSLQSLAQLPMDRSVAVVVELNRFGWVSVDWSGHVLELETMDRLTSLAKHQVSALVLCQETKRVLSVLSERNQ